MPRSVVPALRLRSRTAASILLIAALAAAGGCGNAAGQADREVDDDINQALPKLAGTGQELSDAQMLLGKAAGIESASPAQRIRAKVLQGQAELQAAELMQPKIDSTEVEIRRLAWDINSLAAQLLTHNQIADALQQYDPAKLQDALKQDVTAVQGDPSAGPDWVKNGDNAIKTLAATNDTINTLQSQVNDLQAKVKSLTDQRSKLQLDGDKLTEQSELARGDKAVALFKQAADDRRKADDLSLQIDQTTITLNRAQADLNIRQGQLAVLNEAIKAYGDQSGAAQSRWGDVQKQVDAQREAAKAVLGDETEAVDLAKDPTGGLTIAAKAATLADLASKNDKNRDAALPHVNTAIQCFRDAQTIATHLKSDLDTKAGLLQGNSASHPEIDAWNATKRTLDASHFELQQARAQLQLATLAAGQAEQAQLRQELAATIKPMLDADKLALPLGLEDPDNKIADAAKTGTDQANAAFKAADDLLDGIIEGSAPDEQKKAAQSARVFADYSWYLWAIAQKDPAADDHLKAALAMRDAVTANGSPMRNLPPQLAVAPAASTPGGGPTTAPTP